MSWIIKAGVAFAIAIAGGNAAAHEFKIKGFEFIHPWTREPAEHVKDVPVYMVLRNTGTTPDRIVAASSPFATKVELRSAKSDGEGQLQAINVAPNTTVELSASGPHIMLVGLKEPLDGYQYFPLTLSFERAGDIAIEVYVEEPN